MSSRLIIGLRGLTRGNVHWGPFPEVLKKTVPGIYFLPLEMAGNGNRSSELSHIHPIKAVQDLRRQVQAWKESHPEINITKVTVVAISLGGMIGLKWLELYPDEMDQLIVVNSSLKQLSPFYHRLRPSHYLNIFKTVAWGTIADQEKLILEMTSNRLNLSQKFLPVFIEAAEKNKFLPTNFFRQLILASRIKIKKPLSIKPLFLCSLNDRLVSWTCSRDLSQKFNGTLQINDQAGHDLALDQPEWLAQEISFLQNPPQNH